MKEIKLVLLLFFAFSTQKSFAQPVDSLPVTAKPVFALEAGSPFFPVLDTMYLDSTNMVVVDSTNWIPVYQTRTNGENGEISPGYPWLIAFTRTSERITYCKTTDFSPVEGVLYDFNLMQGDSAWIVTWTNAAVDSALYVVDSVKYKDCLHGDSLKHMYVRALANPTSMFHSHRTVWIEGIGDI